MRASGHVERVESKKDTRFESIVTRHWWEHTDQSHSGSHGEALEKGTLSGHPILGVRMVLQDGAIPPFIRHANRRSYLSDWLLLARFREADFKTKPVTLETIMTAEVVTQ